MLWRGEKKERRGVEGREREGRKGGERGGKRGTEFGGVEEKRETDLATFYLIHLSTFCTSIRTTMYRNVIR